MARIVSLILGGALTVAPSAIADSDQLAPEGWAKTRDGAMTRYTSPSGKERIVTREITSVSDPLIAARMIAEGSGGSASDCALEPSGQLAKCEATLDVSGADLLMRVYVAESGSYLTSLLHMGMATERGIRRRLDASGDRMASLGAPSAEPKPIVTRPTAPISASPVEHVLFDLNYVGGIGGAFYPKYTPVYLFKGGEVCNCADLAPGDVDLNQLSRSRPEDIGEWRKAGSKYAVRYNDGDTDAFDPSIGPPSALPNGQLVGRYSSIGGGGNTALGGSAIVIASKDYDFRADGTFYQESFGGGGNRTVTAGATRGALGKWRLDGTTLSLEYPDGSALRTSVFWDSKGDFVNGSPDAIWIGGKAYSLED